MQLAALKRLQNLCESKKTLLCLGIDPRSDDLSEARSRADFIISEVSDCVAAVKFNSAFFESFGGEGLDVMCDLIAKVKSSAFVIVDGKRGDIAETSEAYAQSAFNFLDADAVTVNPFMGLESIEPFIKNPERGAFVLCKTSNIGSREYQELILADGSKLYEKVAHDVKMLHKECSVGLVVGATDYSSAKNIRKIAPESWFLMPGVGAQGGRLEEIIPSCLNSNKTGVLINVSRAIWHAEDPKKTATELNNLINRLQDESK